MDQNDNGLSRPPGKLLQRGEAFHNPSFYDSMWIRLDNGLFQQVNVAQSTFRQSIHQSNPKCIRRVVTGTMHVTSTVVVVVVVVVVVDDDDAAVVWKALCVLVLQPRTSGGVGVDELLLQSFLQFQYMTGMRKVPEKIPFLEILSKKVVNVAGIVGGQGTRTLLLCRWDRRVVVIDLCGRQRPWQDLISRGNVRVIKGSVGMGTLHEIHYQGGSPILVHGAKPRTLIKIDMTLKLQFLRRISRVVVLALKNFLLLGLEETPALTQGLQGMGKMKENKSGTLVQKTPQGNNGGRCCCLVWQWWLLHLSWRFWL